MVENKYEPTLNDSAFFIIPIIIMLIIAILVCVNQMIARGAGWFEIITTTATLTIGGFVLLLIFSAYGITTVGRASGILATGSISFMVLLSLFWLFVEEYTTGPVHNHLCLGIQLTVIVYIILMILMMILGIIFGIIEMALKFPLVALFVTIIIALISNPEWQENFFLLLAVLLLLSAAIGVAISVIGCIVAIAYVVLEALSWISDNQDDVGAVIVIIVFVVLIVIFFNWIYSFFTAVL